MKIIISGGAGFIGSHLAREFCQGNEVWVIDNLSSGSMENLSSLWGKIKFVRADITKPEGLEPVFREADALLHHAALTSVAESIKNPKPTLLANVEGTRNMLELARKADVKRVVLASSASVYGDAKKQPVGEEDVLFPKSPYAQSKIANEADAKEFYKLYGMKTISLRYFNVYGPRQSPQSHYAPVIPKFICSMLSKKSPPIYGDGRQSRNFIFVKDVAAANRLALNASLGFGKAYNIASAQSATILQLYALIAKETKFSGAPVFEPARVGDILHSEAKISNAREDLGFEPAFALQGGLKETVKWFAANPAEIQ